MIKRIIMLSLCVVSLAQAVQLTVVPGPLNAVIPLMDYPDLSYLNYRLPQRVATIRIISPTPRGATVATVIGQGLTQPQFAQLKDGDFIIVN